MTIQELESRLRDRSVPLGVRIADLITAEGLTFSNKAWLGEVLLHDCTSKEEKAVFKEKVGQLERLIESWRSRSRD